MNVFTDFYPYHGYIQRIIFVELLYIFGWCMVLAKKNLLKNSEYKFIDYLSFLSLFIVLIYIFSVFYVNFIGRESVNYDMYSDAILTKYISMEKSIFPKGWHFGNQVYVVATPVLGAFFYPLVNDAYSALCIASCVMTVLCFASYIWLIKPFATKNAIIISLLVLVGGVTVGGDAISDVNGLQLFYTMASYYACYIICIFFTLGISLRILNKISVNKFFVFMAFLLNFALGVQSLRETLVLNLPIVAVSVLFLIIDKIKCKELSQHKNNVGFVLLMLVSNVLGLFFEKIMIFTGKIEQHTIIKDAHTGLIENIKKSVDAFFVYIGFIIPSNAKQAVEFFVVLFMISMVAVAMIAIIINLVKKGSATPIEIAIVFFAVSVVAVFCSGIFVIKLSPRYFFCWYPLVTLCVCYIIDKKWKKANAIKNLLVLILLCISILNYKPLFFSNFKTAPEMQNNYQEIAKKLLDDDIKYLYSDCSTAYNGIATSSFDEITYVTLDLSNDPNDLWNSFDYLYHDSWFEKENFDSSYIVISDKTLSGLDSNFSHEYKEEFMSNLDFVYKFDANDVVLYFFKGSEKMYHDMIN